MKFALIEACVFSWLVVAPASANGRAVDIPPVTALGSDPAPSGAGDEAAPLVDDHPRLPVRPGHSHLRIVDCRIAARRIKH